MQIVYRFDRVEYVCGEHVQSDMINRHHRVQQAAVAAVVGHTEVIIHDYPLANCNPVGQWSDVVSTGFQQHEQLSKSERRPSRVQLFMRAWLHMFKLVNGSVVGRAGRKRDTIQSRYTSNDEQES